MENADCSVSPGTFYKRNRAMGEARKERLLQEEKTTKVQEERDGERLLSRDSKEDKGVRLRVLSRRENGGSISW